MAPAFGATAAAPKKEEAALISAAVIYNIARFSTWPPISASSSAYFYVCHDGDDHLADAFATIAGRDIGERTVRAVAIVDLSFAGRCDVYFTARKSNGDLLTRMAEERTLTIGSDDAFLERGGAVRLTIKGKSRFSVNVRNAHAAGVQPSSKLLRLAEEVVE